MTEETKLPFHSFAFTLIENRRPRTSLRLAAGEDALFELRVQKGSVANPSAQFTRQVPLDVAKRLRDALQAIGVFGWDAEYGDVTAPGSRRWTLSIVFERDVFSIESKGGSDVPPGFDSLLEELYRLDFPRPTGAQGGGSAGGGAGGFGSGASGIAGGLGSGAVPPVMPTSIGDLAAFASGGGLPDFDSAELQQRMKEEFRHMSSDEQRQLIDMLVQTGLGSRDFWERFFRT